MDHSHATLSSKQWLRMHSDAPRESIRTWCQAICRQLVSTWNFNSLAQKLVRCSVEAKFSPDLQEESRRASVSQCCLVVHFICVLLRFGTKLLASSFTLCTSRKVLEPQQWINPCFCSRGEKFSPFTLTELQHSYQGQISGSIHILKYQVLEGWVWKQNTSFFCPQHRDVGFGLNRQNTMIHSNRWFCLQKREALWSVEATLRCVKVFSQTSTALSQHWLVDKRTFLPWSQALCHHFHYLHGTTGFERAWGINASLIFVCILLKTHHQQNSDPWPFSKHSTAPRNSAQVMFPKTKSSSPSWPAMVSKYGGRLQ